jgi:hypothetical protein
MNTSQIRGPLEKLSNNNKIIREEKIGHKLYYSRNCFEINALTLEGNILDIFWLIYKRPSIYQRSVGRQLNLSPSTVDAEFNSLVLKKMIKYITTCRGIELYSRVCFEPNWVSKHSPTLNITWSPNFLKKPRKPA